MGEVRKRTWRDKLQETNPLSGVRGEGIPYEDMIMAKHEFDMENFRKKMRKTPDPTGALKKQGSDRYKRMLRDTDIQDHAYSRLGPMLSITPRDEKNEPGRYRTFGSSRTPTYTRNYKSGGSVIDGYDYES